MGSAARAKSALEGACDLPSVTAKGGRSGSWISTDSPELPWIILNDTSITLLLLHASELVPGQPSKE